MIHHIIYVDSCNLTHFSSCKRCRLHQRGLILKNYETLFTGYYLCLSMRENRRRPKNLVTNEVVTRRSLVTWLSWLVMCPSSFPKVFPRTMYEKRSHLLDPSNGHLLLCPKTWVTITDLTRKFPTREIHPKARR